EGPPAPLTRKAGIPRGIGAPAYVPPLARGGSEEPSREGSRAASATTHRADRPRRARRGRVPSRCRSRPERAPRTATGESPPPLSRRSIRTGPRSLAASLFLVSATGSQFSVIGLRQRPL